MTMISLRLDDELADWATAYAASREVTRTALLEEAIRSFREDCLAGVPEIRAMARAQSSVHRPGDPVGVCKANAAGHVLVDGDCVHCKMPGRVTPDEVKAGRVSVLDETTAMRSALFARLRAPASAHGKKKADA